MIVNDVTKALLKEGQPKPGDIETLARFFKTGPGGYGEGDQFLGVKVPATRIVAKQYKDLSLADLKMLLESEFHEVRLLAAIIMANQAKKADDTAAKQLLDFYLKHTTRLNNWDIIDLSCRDVVGEYVRKRPQSRPLLYTLAKSSSVWDRRIAIVSTWALIRAGELDDTYAIAELLYDDKHDLIQKAVGWMLRETDKHDKLRLKAYVLANAQRMPRTTLRYAIEHFSPQERATMLAIKLQK